MHIPSLKPILLLSAFLAVSTSSIEFLAGDQLVSWPAGEASETFEVELESELEQKEGFDVVLPPCFVLQPTGFEASQLAAPPFEQLLQVVLEQNAPRPPPVLFA